MDRIRICAEDEIADGDALLVPAELTGTGGPIAVFASEGGLFALDDTCTHNQASLSEGWVEAGEVECPLHGGRFCLRTGAAVGAPATEGTVTHAVRAEDGQVWLTPGTAAP